MPISLEHVSFTYMKGTPFEKTALHDVNLQIEKGEFVAVIGHTGSGKSTLVQHLSGLLHPQKGSVCVDGVNLNAKNAAAKKARNSVGMVFQYPEHQIFAETVYEDIAFGPRNKGLTPEETDRAVKDAMAFAGLDFETFAQRSPIPPFRRADAPRSHCRCCCNGAGLFNFGRTFCRIGPARPRRNF